MTLVQGELKLVTDRPVDSISEVWVRARETRGQGDGLTVGVNDRVSVADGALEFTALPGAAVLVLVQNGIPVETLPMLIGDEAQQSLRLVVQAGQVAGSADKSVIEQLAAEIAASITRAEQYRTEAASSASKAKTSETAASKSASNAKTSETRAKTSETNAKTSETNAASSASASASSASSSKTQADKSAASETAAAGSAAAAKTSETKAASSASASASSASSSKTQADKAATSATQAGAARDAAKASETATAASAAAAKTSETNSKQHETTAGDYAAVATTAATEAVGAMERATEIAGGDFATREYVGQSTTALTSWTADAVGGRNLLQGSSAEPTELNLTATMYYRDIATGVRLEEGQEYTFSVIVEKLSDDDHPITIQLGTGTGKNYTRDITQPRRITPGERTVITFTPNAYQLDGRTHLAWRIRNERNETRVAYREAKLERGLVATSWTPAPEDSVQSLLEGNPLSSLLSPFPAHNPAHTLWVDNSVGTRVFVGDVMIYGDTGWRSYPDLFPDLDASESLHEIKMRRVNDRVEIVINAIASADGSVLSSYLPLGAPSYSFNPSIGTITIANVMNYIGNHWSSTRLRSQRSATQGDRVSAVISYTTHSEWPTTLPGTPA